MADPPFQLPDGVTFRRAQRALLFLLEVTGPGGRHSRRVTQGDWDRLHRYQSLKPETLRTSWSRAKSDLIRLGAPVRREPDGRRMEFAVLPGAWEFAHKTLDALIVAYPPQPRRPPRERDYEAADRRSKKRYQRRQQVRRLRLYEQKTVREIAEEIGASVGTVHNDLKDLGLVGTWQCVWPNLHTPARCIAAIQEGVRQVVQDVEGRGSRGRADALMRLVDEVARLSAGGFLIDEWDDPDVEFDYEAYLRERSESA